MPINSERGRWNSNQERLAHKLNRLFDSILNGKQSLTPQNGPLFLESICAQADPATCINKLIAASKTGLPSLQAAMRYDLSVSFADGLATTVITYMQAPGLETIGGGYFIQQIVAAIVEPPIFWNVFSAAFQAGELQENGRHAFGWLLLQLISLPGDRGSSYRELAQDEAILDRLSISSRPDTKALVQKIRNILATFNNPIPADSGESVPGGRHDNDFVDFRDICILPTADEITCTARPFLRPSSALDDPEMADNRTAVYLDNLFRLLREDMIFDMREELQLAQGKKKGKRRGFFIDGMTPLGVYCGTDKKRVKWGISFECESDLPQFKGKKKEKDRKAVLTDDKKVLRHQALSCLLVDDEVVAFPTVNRDEDLLVKVPPIIILQFEGEATTTKTLLKLKTGTRIKLIQIDTAVFAYEPILKAIQGAKESSMECPPAAPMHIVDALRRDPHQDLRALLQIQQSNPIKLDKSQAESLLASLTQRVSLIQGPPGTGKSFIGALLATALYDSTGDIILVVCYTNHALDQFLEDLMNIGIPATSMVRLGKASNSQTEALSLYKQNRDFRLGRTDWQEIDGYRTTTTFLAAHLDASFDKYISSNVQDHELLEHLEFEAPEFYQAFYVPNSNDGMTQVGKKGRAVDSVYLLRQWQKGWDAGIFKQAPHVRAASQIWEMTPAQRKSQVDAWTEELIKERVGEIYSTAVNYNEASNNLDRKFNQHVSVTLRSKRIIGCTTTAAAKYSDDIQAASPGVLLVEEAGEILESHVLTALGAKTKQLILIGDHKQLRPKVNHYLLTVEKGEGYDLNRSLFERLILKGYPHETLSQQHRMRPEISSLIRALTYPDLVDADSTKNRPNIRGLQDDIVFINHSFPEDDLPQVADRKDATSTSSKQNTYEAEMVLKIVRYLGQQGYGTDKLVILTPYLGQLHKLQAMLRQDNDPILNDLDSHDLVRAGLVPAATANMSKKRIRLATIDNYQGEESDIVIVSLTRSNSNHDIGFMFSPERVNVLLSRARLGMIMLGNAETFMQARRGKELWTKLFDLLKRSNRVHDGLPVKCERHPTRMALLKRPHDFTDLVPDGGCQEPCGTLLNCNIHNCPSKCHQLYDHSKMRCESIMKDTCSKGHPLSWTCHEGRPPACKKCERETKLAEEKQRQAFALQRKREEDDRAHAAELKKLDEEIAQERQKLRDEQLAQERANVIQQKQKDVEEARSMSSRVVSSIQTVSATLSLGSGSSPHAVGPIAATTAAPAAVPRSPTTHSKVKASAESKPPASKSQPTQQTPSPSESEQEWERQKTMEGASNESIDAIMHMTGLEEVKAQVLRIKDKIEITQRQNTSLKSERFNIVLLGNPGTGKTTVARHYAKFLTSLQVLPGAAFVETTGSRLANDGVAGIKKHIEEVINAGGGAIFVDEAYQLKSEHSFQGSQVLDFLLAEMENNVGSIVFILAGYSKQMEKFFEHNPGLTSRVPYMLQFADYKDSELRLMFERMITKKYNRQMELEDGFEGLYSRIVIRRLGRGRGREGFGNARALENLLAKIGERQAARIAKERKKGPHPNDFLFTKEDLIGPDPSQVLIDSAAWKKLQKLIGLTEVKESIRNLFDLIDSNYQRELKEKDPIQMSLNRVFLGSPGTGKTSVAKLYGQILADLGLLSNGEVVLKNPADFIDSVLGGSESKTKAILASTVGKVLIIDEVCVTHFSPSGTGSHNDPYKTAVIDTIVAEVQSVPGEDRCVLLLGYKDQIVEMFQNVNPGLARRFAIENAFHFEDFNDQQLLEILQLKLKDQDLEATDEAKAVAINLLSRARNRPNFGNAGEVENVLGQAKARYQTRQASLPVKQRRFDVVFEPRDFDPDFDRGARASSNLQKIFEDVIGCEDIVAKLRGYQDTARRMKARRMDPRDQIPTTFVMKGPPGTGKTTTARKMGQVFYDMGFLSSPDVIECSASDLVGQYVGQTGPKTQKLMEKALGKVLFIDEAYRLGEGHFAKEAIDELVSVLTQPRFLHKVVVILAGYDQDMNRLMSVNAGLWSRFSEEITFVNMAPARCLEVLKKGLMKKNVYLNDLDNPSSDTYQELEALIQELSNLPSWGNARDVGTLAKQMISHVFTHLPDSDPPNADSRLLLSGTDAVACTKSMLTERRARYINVGPAEPRSPLFETKQQMLNPPPPPPPLPPSTRTASSVKTAPDERRENRSGPSQSEAQQRDPGVSDKVWLHLQEAKKAAEFEAKRAAEEQRRLEQQLQEAKEHEEAVQVFVRKLAEARAKDDAEQAELKRKLEEVRLREYRLKVERERREAALKAKMEEEARRRKQEAMAQAKLRKMGVCVAGYQCIKISGGYRCAGGSHYVSDAALGL
ncbi:P-loop containing nucleoside triphosphate hydrolase protein [Sparassis latifolia]